MTAPFTKLSQAERTKLIEDHLGYVRTLASAVNRDLGGKLEFDELTAFGNRGLVEAAHRFNPGRGVTFTTFSYYRIRGAIFDGLRKTGWLGRTQYARFQAASNDLLHNLSDRSSPPVPSNTEATLQDFAHNLDQLATVFVTSLDSTRALAQADSHALDAEALMANEGAAALVRQAIDNLPPRERELIELYYFDDLTLEAAGKRLGLSKSWTSRLHARAIRSLTGLLRPALAD